MPDRPKKPGIVGDNRERPIRTKDRHCNDCGERIPRNQDANVCDDCLYAILKDSDGFDI